MTTPPGDLRLEDVIDAASSHEATLKRFDSIKTVPVLHHSPATTAMSHQQATHYPSCPNTNCTYHRNNEHPRGGGVSRSRLGYANQYRVSPYGRSGPSGETLGCHYCGKLGPTQNICFNKYPHLKPEWMMQDERKMEPPKKEFLNQSHQVPEAVSHQNVPPGLQQNYTCDIQ